MGGGGAPPTIKESKSKAETMKTPTSQPDISLKSPPRPPPPSHYVSQVLHPPHLAVYVQVMTSMIIIIGVTATPDPPLTRAKHS